jgi:hypothetical protein
MSTGAWTVAADGTANVVIGQGETFNPTLTYRDDNSALVDLTSFTARMHVRESYAASTIALTLTTENGGITLGGVAGTIALFASATDMAALTVPDSPGTPPRKEYVYDLELVSGAGIVTRLVRGKFTVTREVTR